MQEKTKLDHLIQTVLDEMVNKRFCSKVIREYSNSFDNLKQVAKKMKMDHLTEELLSAFQNDATNNKTGKHSWTKERHRIRCAKLLTSLSEKGVIDWSKKKSADVSNKITNPTFLLSLGKFISQLEENGLRPNTISGYKRIVTYFLIFCQEKGYKDSHELQVNDVTEFITKLYQNKHFKPTTIGGLLSGLRRFLSNDDYIKQFLLEIPIHLPRERKIVEVYDQEELSSIKNLLSGDSLSKRDIAICTLLLETGLRGIDLCELKLADIDWNNDVIYIVQDKTGKPLNIPLKSSYGNAIIDYILNERPDSDSKHLFLKSLAPYEKLGGAGAIYVILEKMEEKAAIKKEGRMIGSRLTRHNAASTMLRAGIPMSDISAMLGHKNPNVVLVYLSTDEKTLAGCTLTMPVVRKRGI